MKQKFAVLLSSCLLFLAACTGLGTLPSDASPEQNHLSAPDFEKPDYQIDTVASQKQFHMEDGTELARYDYQLLSLSVPNLENLSPEEAEPAQRNIDNFNSKMVSIMEDSVHVGQDLGDAAQYDHDTFGLRTAYYDETTASAALLGQMISVRIDNTSYTGGAHPNRYTFSFLFDLESGQFINPIQIAENPESFRTGAADLLLKRADAIPENEGNYWLDYKEIIAHWNEAAVLFDRDGMLVIYSPYDLGPYAMGDVELRLTWDEVKELAGKTSLEHFGIT